MKFKEVEFKYSADTITLTAFKEFCATRENLLKCINAAGYDHFYENEDDAEAFCRHRVGTDINQLTFKRKTKANNNFIRTEHNLTLDRSMSLEAVAALCNEFHYKHNVTIYKNCFIYEYDWYTLVYYIVYDKDMKEKGRYLEIEMREDYHWSTEQEAWDSLLVMEKICKPLGISPQCRIKRSLYEMFKEEQK